MNCSFMPGLFVVGCGLALLQVAVNPYLGALGGPARAASRLNLAGGFNSVAGTIAPRVGAAFVFIAGGASSGISALHAWTALGAGLLPLALMTAIVPLPILLTERVASGKTAQSAWSFRHLRRRAGHLHLCGGGGFDWQPADQLPESALHGRVEPCRGGALCLVLLEGAMLARFAGFFILRHVRPATALGVVAALAVVFQGATKLVDGRSYSTAK